VTVELNIEMQRNGDYSRTSQLLDDAGLPIDLTSNSMALDIRRLAGEGGEPVASAAVEIEPGIMGYFTETIRGADLGPLTGDYRTIRLAYDLRRVDGAGLITIERRGILSVIPGVTYGG
jgi:hypothetical protein